MKQSNATGPAKQGQKTEEHKRNIGKSLLGNKNAEKWSEGVVVEKLEQMLRILCEDEATGEKADNIVRANTIKLHKEVCLMVGINGVIFSEWKEKFCKTRRKNSEGDWEENVNYSATVSELTQTISDICECRLQYSGMRMDEFILKNHYNYVDQIDHTTNGKDMPSTTVGPIVQIVEQI